MSGIVIPLIRRQRFDFSFLGASEVKTLNLRRAVPVQGFGTGEVLTRLHGAEVADRRAIFEVKLYTTDPSSTDQQSFAATSAAATVTIENGDTPPKLFRNSLSTFGPFLKVDFVATGGQAQDALWADLEVELLVRDN